MTHYLDVLQWCTDACSHCDHVQKPFQTQLSQTQLSQRSRIRAEYRCDNCFHKWFTSWELNFAVNHAVANLLDSEHP